MTTFTIFGEGFGPKFPDTFEIYLVPKYKVLFSTQNVTFLYYVYW
jgi:hypothetical protein